MKKNCIGCATFYFVPIGMFGLMCNKLIISNAN
jgi:hypothetical protein